MEDYTFNFEVNGAALPLLVRAVDRYVEKWPGGNPQDQENLKIIQLELRKALLDFHFIEGDH